MKCLQAEYIMPGEDRVLHLAWVYAMLDTAASYSNHQLSALSEKLSQTALIRLSDLFTDYALASVALQM